jgi:UDP-N-acetylmuramate--alanine ligase
LDLTEPHRVHIVGVGGAGMSAIATVLASMGHTVTGSDLKDSPGLERLRALGIDVVVGHAAENVGLADLVAISTAIPERNAEVAWSRAHGVTVLRRAEILAAITRSRRTIAVSGTHGKTTTSSMLALVLIEAGLRPSFIIGGEVNEIGTGAVWDTADLLVVEADESDGTFTELERQAVVVTSVEPDHLEHYGDFDSLVAAFEQFVEGGGGPAVVCADDEGAATLAERTGATTYGTSETAAYRMVEVVNAGAGSAFDVVHDGDRLGQVRLPVPGLHNARNACAALVCGMAIGASFDDGARALARFAGVARRFEFRGESNGVTYIDDYAHLPTEVRAALQAARQHEWRRVVCVFQPHRYSRTASLWADFADGFDDSDLLVVTDVYPAGEVPRPGVSGKLIVDAVLGHRPWHQVAYLPRHPDLVRYLEQILRPGDLCLTLGAGDLTSLPDELQLEVAS